VREMACPDMEERILDLLFSSLREEEEESLREHMKDCPACRTAHREMQGIAGDLRPVSGATAPPGFGQRVRAGVLDRIEAGPDRLLGQVGRCALLAGLGLFALTAAVMADWSWILDMMQLSWALIGSVMVAAASLIGIVAGALVPAGKALGTLIGPGTVAIVSAAYLTAAAAVAALVLLWKGHAVPVEENAVW